MATSYFKIPIDRLTKQQQKVLLKVETSGQDEWKISKKDDHYYGVSMADHGFLYVYLIAHDIDPHVVISEGSIKRKAVQ